MTTRLVLLSFVIYQRGMMQTRGQKRPHLVLADQQIAIPRTCHIIVAHGNVCCTLLLYAPVLRDPCPVITHICAIRKAFAFQELCQEEFGVQGALLTILHTNLKCNVTGQPTNDITSSSSASFASFLL